MAVPSIVTPPSAPVVEVEAPIHAIEPAAPQPINPAPVQTPPVWAKPQAQPNGNRPYFFAQATKGSSPVEAPAPRWPRRSPEPVASAQPGASKAALAVDDRPELESLSFPKDGLSRAVAGIPQPARRDEVGGHDDRRNGQTDPTAAAQPERLRVLLVDDNASVLRFLASAFSSNHCQVTTAATAEQALEQLGDDPFHLVVSDIKMPGLSGLDLLRAVKGRQPGTPVVLITGVPSVNSAVFGLRHGAYDYLPKPFSVTEVKDLIQRLRRDRADGNGNVNYPAGLTEELARRQAGVEAISRIGEVALQGLEPSVFAEKVLEYTMQSLRCDGALMLLRDQAGQFNASRKGEPSLVGQILALLHASFGDVVKTAGRETLVLTKPEHGFEGLAALVPGVGDAMGILCIGRAADNGAFLPDEKALLLGYAQTTAVALQKILPARASRTEPDRHDRVVRDRARVEGPVPQGPLRARVAVLRRARDGHGRPGGRRRPDEPRRHAARPRQAGHHGQHPPQAAAADRGGVRADPHPSGGRRQDPASRCDSSRARPRRSATTTSATTARATRTA